MMSALSHYSSASYKGHYQTIFRRKLL